MAKKQPTIAYEPRERLDGELEQAIGDILSAENEAKRIIDRAEASVKAVQLDGATRERNMREHAESIAASKMVEAVKAAEAQADKAVADMIASAHEKGKALVEEKRKVVEKRATELFDMLRGK